MQKIKKRSSILIIILVLALLSGGLTSYASSKSDETSTVTNLMIESIKTPLGIDEKDPAFSWQMKAPEEKRGFSQIAYQIIVKDQNDNVVWDTNKVESSNSINIQYNGDDLQATTRYDWKVTVWDQNGNTSSNTSWFETGLMNSDPALSAWNGATWIGGGDDDLVLKADYLNVFKINYSFQLDKESSSDKGSFVLGANDPRLMDKNKNIRNIESGKDESYIEFELDISAVDGSESGLAKLNIYRVGYTKDDSAKQPFVSYDVPLDLIDNSNKYDNHDIHLWSDSGMFQIFMDGTGGENRITPNNVNLNPVGAGGNYISYPMVADIGFKADAGQKVLFTNVEVTNYREPSNTLFTEDLTDAVYKGIYAGAVNKDGSAFAVNNGAYVLTGGKQGTFIVADPSKNAMPMLRTEFEVSDKEIKSARAYVTARGIYELYLNGEKVSNNYFTPGLTQYNESHQYQTYDVTDLINSTNTNAIGAMLGEGWWSGGITFTTSRWNHFGDRQSLLAKLVITYKDGSTKIVRTNPDWKYYDDGPLVYGSFFQGEYYDARKEAAVNGWSTAGYDDSSWESAEEVPLDETTSPNELSYEDMELIGQIGEPPSMVKTLTAQSVTEVRDGVFVYDMGQNAVGVPKVTLKNAEPGEKITLRVAEMLYPDLPASGDNVGMIMQENLRAALNQDNYITKAGDQVIQPRFTFHGYRYLEITGIDEALPLDAVQTQVISSVNELSASYETSNEQVNKLWKNITWSMRSNFLSIPTDTPARNERMGWGGDISVFARTATYMGNVNNFLDRHLLALRDMQSDEGRFSDVAPVGGGFGGILWGSAGMTVAWEAYQQYGDTQLLKDHYDSMADYMAYLETRVNPETGFINEGPLGDWLSPVREQTGSVNLWTAYHAYDLRIMSQVAEVLGKNDDATYYSKKYQEKKDYFNETFVDADTKKTLKSDGSIADTQASYAIPLSLGIFSKENTPYAAEYLAKTVKRKNVDDKGITRPEYSLMTGFIGTAAINKALSENGYNDIAYRLLQQTSYPSWLYSVENGATTIWERLNSYTVEDGFGGNNSMNSFNHYSFGAVGAWMMKYSLGIERDPNNPGFKHFILQPTPDPTGLMTYAKGHYDSAYGRINSAWKVKNATLNYNATIPANTTATVYIPTINVNTVKEGNQPISKAEGVTFIEYKDGEAVYELDSGSYNFRSIIKN